ncbi:imidazole glycerol phosphate synthase subunit HisF [Legionella jamestowniensis]|uniref:Imidazole glycerol phosphate synthase subunit HisF n=1 Tax=Legionella jamestowniensis TaxID=455 RepID=A0A0W0UGB7_9GAMM|nr:imidazole glycerol phosphate synthase subunit HisF [Legionella jamestowniensis]KTD06895.1 imidazole glycerol phosphate synthase subunit HisF [Legionella jamestowniensis]OCH97421.1 imidazole glycerol phosphate synthase subunit HisF [Legionella jamestowniensis]SFL85474.1 cyclase [Legionella jamestowniensis DSM 19215]
MLAKRIIPCLDVRNNQVVKGVQFRNHRIVGDILTLAESYSQQGADELVFYDITASSDGRCVSFEWINQVASKVNIPFTVAGGIRHLDTAKAILHAGADKLSLNSPALESPDLIDQLSRVFGSQCVVIGIDTQWIEDDFYVYQYTGDESKSRNSRRKTREWVKEVQQRGAGEIVLNCMQADGVRNGYDLEQLHFIRSITNVPLIASGGAGKLYDFIEVFKKANVDGALAASVFHDQLLSINEVKRALAESAIEVRL